MTSELPTPQSALAGLSSLVDPVRRRLYDHVAAQDAPVGRDEAASAAGISRTLAAYHLDKLTDAGLLEVSFARPDGRGGPGAGRPAKLYARVREEVTASIPPRNYALLAELLAGAAATDPTGEVEAAFGRAATSSGADAGRRAGELWAALEQLGYEPAEAATGEIVLRNCPFHAIARLHTALVCGMNEALIQGALTGTGGEPGRARLCPREGRCCVVIDPEGEPVRPSPPSPPGAGAPPSDG